MTDEPTPADETTELDAATETTTTTTVARDRHQFDRRSGLIAAAGIVGLLAAFAVGLAIGHHHDGDGRFDRVRGERGMQVRGDGPGGGGMPGAPGGDVGRGGRFGGGDERGGRHGGGVIGVVTKASSDELTVDPLRDRGGDGSSITVKIDSDTDVHRTGSDGPEDAKISDVDTGAIVAVRSSDSSSSDDDSTLTAGDVLILRAADA